MQEGHLLAQELYFFDLNFFSIYIYIYGIIDVVITDWECGLVDCCLTSAFTYHK